MKNLILALCMAFVSASAARADIASTLAGKVTTHETTYGTLYTQFDDDSDDLDALLLYVYYNNSNVPSGDEYDEVYACQSVSSSFWYSAQSDLYSALGNLAYGDYLLDLASYYTEADQEWWDYCFDAADAIAQAAGSLASAEANMESAFTFATYAYNVTKSYE